jgi:hypothetical protein
VVPTGSLINRTERVTEIAGWGDFHTCLRLRTPLSSWALKADMQDWEKTANYGPPFQPRDGRSSPAPLCSLYLIDIFFPIL